MEKSEKHKIVENYLSKREIRSLKRIALGSELNHKIFILSVAMIAVLPLIPETNKNNFLIPTAFVDLNYSDLTALFFGILSGLLFLNIILGLINIKRKIEYKNLLKEIQKLKSKRA